MDNITLGKRIKEARLAKKMTQSEVVGTFITRNMLSQIESGTATPSVKTLEYLSNVLELPLDQLMSAEANSVESSEEPPESDSEIYFKLKKKFLANNYESVLDIIKDCLLKDHPYYDECCAIYCRCCLQLGNKAFENRDYSQALDWSNKASQYAQNGCYASRDIRTQALMLMNNIADKLTDEIK